MPVLELSGVGKAFGGFAALKNVSIVVKPGERRAVLGPNGAGKSTLFNIVGGQAKPTSGRLRLFDEDITGHTPHELWADGLSRTFQRNQLFQGLTVRQNARLAAMRRHVGAAFRLGTSWGAVDDEVAEVLSRVGLSEQIDRPTSALAYGEQRQLEVALALMGRPRLLLLDEPTAGMSPAETDAVMRILSELPTSITIMLVEHDMDVVFALCDRITVLHLGEVLAEGSPAEIASDADVRRVYMGTTEH